MHCLIIGQTGQLAKALQDEVQGGVFTADFLDRNALDLSGSRNDIVSALSKHLNQADAIIIAAAYTAVDNAEKDYTTALAVNGVAPGLIAAEAATRNIPVLHVSTDYVFAGDGTQPYKTDSPIDPLNGYGRSKAAGEIAVLNANPNAAVLRTSWVYDGTGKNFMTTMLRLAKSRDTIGVVADQIGRPTYAVDLARACVIATRALVDRKQGVTGVFHVSNTGPPISWADFARAIFDGAAHTIPHAMTVNGIPSSEFPTPAKRPTYSVMDTTAFEGRFGMDLPEWRNGLARALQSYRKAQDG